jgi:hypothetical protein
MTDHRETEADRERKDRLDAAARAAYVRLRRGQTYEDWRTVGGKLMLITEEVLNELGLIGWDPDNKKLVKEVTARFQLWERSTMPEGSNDPVLGKDERNKLRVLMTDQKYHDWYMTLPGPQRRKLNYPGAIIAKYKAQHPTPEQQAVRNAAAAKRAEPAATKPSAGDTAHMAALQAPIAELKKQLAERDRMIAGLQQQVERSPTKAAAAHIEKLERENVGLKAERDLAWRAARKRLADEPTEAEKILQHENASLRGQVAHWKAEAKREPNAELERLRGLLRKRVRLGPKTIKSIQFCLHPDHFKTDVEKEHAERAFKWFGSLGIEPKPE